MVAFCRAVLPACTITQYEWAGILHERQDYHPRMSGRYSAPDKESEIFEFLNFEVTTTLLYPRIYKLLSGAFFFNILNISQLLASSSVSKKECPQLFALALLRTSFHAICMKVLLCLLVFLMPLRRLI